MKNKLYILILLIFLFSPVDSFGKDPATECDNTIISTPDMRPGLTNLTFKSKIDNTLQPMQVKVPLGYTKTKSWPLLVVLHGLGDGPITVSSINSMVQIGPFGRGYLWYRSIGEQDVFECIELAKQIFNIDPDKIYLCGFSMGAIGTFELGLKYPDKWAACVPVCGRMENLYLIPNGCNLPFWINTGSKDDVVPAKHSKKIYNKAVELGYKHWKYTEYENMGHSFWVNWTKIEEWLLSHKKINNPSSINFISENPAKSYWIEIADKYNSAETARIKAEITSQTINLKTLNISDYKLYLKDAPINLSQDLTIIENDKVIFQGHLSPNGIFNKKINASKTDKVYTEQP